MRMDFIVLTFYCIFIARSKSPNIFNYETCFLSWYKDEGLSLFRQNPALSARYPYIAVAKWTTDDASRHQ